MRGDRYQVALIVLGTLATCLLGYFVYQELFPEYRIYQNDYIELEKFRSTYTGDPPPPPSTKGSNRSSLKGKIEALPPSIAASLAMSPHNCPIFHPRKSPTMPMAMSSSQQREFLYKNPTKITSGRASTTKSPNYNKKIPRKPTA